MWCLAVPCLCVLAVMLASTVSSAAHWDQGSHQLVVTGTPQMPACKVGMVIINGKNVKASVCTDPTGHRSAVLPAP